MAAESANQALRQIQSLYVTGSVGGLTDAQLIERFVSRIGAEREDAFAALVQRHGPMVLRICRRMSKAERIDLGSILRRRVSAEVAWHRR